MTGRELILLGFERWQEYCRQREGRAVRKSLTDFYAEAFDEALSQAKGKNKEGGA